MAIDTSGIRSRVVLVDYDRSRIFCNVIPMQIGDGRVARLSQDRSLTFGLWRLDRVIGACSRAPSRVARRCSRNEHSCALRTTWAFDALAEASGKEMTPVSQSCLSGTKLKFKDRTISARKRQREGAAVNNKRCFGQRR